MAGITFDSSVFISYRRDTSNVPPGFRMSVVVLQELIAGAQDKSEIQTLVRAYKLFEKEERLLVPDAEDWIITGKVINALQNTRRSRKTGAAPVMPVLERVRIINDVLIARTSKRAGVAIVTANVRDFEKIKQYCNVRLIKASEFFRRRSG